MDKTSEVEDFIQIMRHSWWTNLMEPVQRHGVMRGVPDSSLLQWQILQMSPEVLVDVVSAFCTFMICNSISAIADPFLT